VAAGGPCRAAASPGRPPEWARASRSQANRTCHRGEELRGTLKDSPTFAPTLPPRLTWDDGRSLGGWGQLQARIGHRCEAAPSGKVRSDEGQRPGAARNPFATSTLAYGSRCRPRDPARFAVPVGRESGRIPCVPQFTVAGVDEGSRSQQHPGTPAATAALAVSRAGARTRSSSGALVAVGREGR
jgi:hypothetical protein